MNENIHLIIICFLAGLLGHNIKSLSRYYALNDAVGNALEFCQRHLGVSLFSVAIAVTGFSSNFIFSFCALRFARHSSSLFFAF
ncbi:MAG: hypothetical protein II649_12185 [Kiritimatiellae bacterium]|nr:hypothetical protein [Kiritimatiellia bacterium]MBQ5795521.1 hypothetical protein [Kiritimatiellia bacterium]